jgi:hypothetical protein
MKHLSHFFLLCLIKNGIGQSTSQSGARNIAIVKDGVANGTFIATSSDSGPLLVKVPGFDEITISLPEGISSMDDISISDDGYLFGLSVLTPTVCSFEIITANLLPIVCIDATGFSLEKFTGFSCRGGICVISGGTGGFTVLDYDRFSGVFSQTLRCLNCNISGTDEGKDLVEVSVMNSHVAAFSAVGTQGFDTLVVDLNTNLPIITHAIPDPVDNTLAVAPTNFPCVSTFYGAKDGQNYLFTACGSITVQSMYNSSTTSTITPAVQDFKAVTLAIDAKNNLLAVGGLSLESSVISLYAIDQNNPMETKLEYTQEIEGKILSMAIYDGGLGFVTLDDTTIMTANFTFTPSPSSDVALTPTVSPNLSATSIGENETQTNNTSNIGASPVAVINPSSSLSPNINQTQSISSAPNSSPAQNVSSPPAGTPSSSPTSSSRGMQMSTKYVFQSFFFSTVLWLLALA